MRNRIVLRVVAFLILTLIIFSFPLNIYASTDIAGIYVSTEVAQAFDEVNVNYPNVNLYAPSHIALTFKKLGYTLLQPTALYTITSYKSTPLSYISASSNNYGFGITCHGDVGYFTLDTSSTSQRVYPSDISGNWHLVILNCCSALSTDSFAQAFHTTSAYSNRAIIGWFNTVTFVAQGKFWLYYWGWAGQDTLRQNCLDVASGIPESTPTRFYGDSSWYGWAW